MDTDDDLAAHLASDLDRHFETLVYTHQDRLYTIAHRFLGNAHDAEDVTQEALVRAYAALGEYPAAQIRSLRLRPWLATIVLNLCRNRVTRRPGPDPLSLHLAGPDGATIAEPAVDPSATPQAIAQRANPLASGRRSSGNPPPVYRAPVVLRHVDGLSYPEVAQALERPEGTVKAQVHRGLALLRIAYETAQRREREEMTA